MKTAVFIFIYGLQLYFVLGIIIALIIQFNGLKKIDSLVEGAGTWFRIITFPGIAGLWPILLYKWFLANKVNAEN